MPWLEVFRTGTHTSMEGQTLNFDEGVLKEIVDTYDSTVHEAPIVIGHPTADARAYGWVKHVRRVRNVLEAFGDQVDPVFAESVRQGHYKKISVSLYAPETPGNPVPGKWGLRHVGFLGAMAPAVKGLRSVALAEGGHVFSFASPYQKEGFVDEIQLKALQAELAARQEELAVLKSRETALKLAEDKLKQEQQQARQARVASFSESLTQKGQLLPVDRPTIEQVLLSLQSAGPVSFGEQKDVSPAQLLEGFLKRLPVVVPMGELVKDQSVTGASFAGPQGFTVDADRLDLHNKALAYQAQHKVDYMTAVRAVGGK